MKNKRIIIAGIAGLVVMGIGIANCNSTPASNTATPVVSTSIADAISAPPVVITSSTAPAATTPKMTIAEQQAVDSAQNYLTMGQGFSKAGLFNQLTSSSGEGYAAADANFAINYLHPDWNAQAVESAKNYLAIGGF